jgi:hypothetical protein
MACGVQSQNLFDADPLDCKLRTRVTKLVARACLVGYDRGIGARANFNATRKCCQH